MSMNAVTTCLELTRTWAQYLVGNMIVFEAHINGLRRLIMLQGELAYFNIATCSGRLPDGEL